VELVLCPEHQSRGIGSTLLRAVIARAENEGKPVRLRTCIENHRAQSFYKRHGFREIGRDKTHLLLECRSWNLQDLDKTSNSEGTD
jgi:ribosomal protein S18 acetylase RimI-like enzyme